MEGAIKGIRALRIRGVNLTRSHKTQVIGYLDDLTPDARRIGSVNTIILRKGKAGSSFPI